MTTKNVTPWFLWPFVAVWDLLALVINIIGRILAALLGLVLMIVGIALIITIAGIPIGPMQLSLEKSLSISGIIVNTDNTGFLGYFANIHNITIDNTYASG